MIYLDFDFVLNIAAFAIDHSYKLWNGQTYNLNVQTARGQRSFKKTNDSASYLTHTIGE